VSSYEAGAFSTFPSTREFLYCIGYAQTRCYNLRLSTLEGEGMALLHEEQSLCTDRVQPTI
jgi:hypothetical protein